MSPDELAYYRERALIERWRASDATNALAANIHVELACLYERLVELEELDAPMLRTVEIGYPAEFDSTKLAPFSGRPLFSDRNDLARRASGPRSMQVCSIFARMSATGGKRTFAAARLLTDSLRQAQSRCGPLVPTDACKPAIDPITDFRRRSY